VCKAEARKPATTIDVTAAPLARRYAARTPCGMAAGSNCAPASSSASGRGPVPSPSRGAHVTEHPWREPAWGLLACALHHAGRRADAPATLRRARAMLAGRLGLDPGAELQSPAVIPGTQSTRT
jgi:hypothetical protein